MISLLFVSYRNSTKKCENPFWTHAPSSQAAFIFFSSTTPPTNPIKPPIANRAGTNGELWFPTNNVKTPQIHKMKQLIKEMITLTFLLGKVPFDSLVMIKTQPLLITPCITRYVKLMWKFLFLYHPKCHCS